MANKESKPFSSFPIQMMIIMALLGAVLSGASFEIIKVWPKPVSVVPYFDFWGGACWGLSMGAVTGLVIGFLTDDSHFEEQS